MNHSKETIKRVLHERHPKTDTSQQITGKITGIVIK